LLGCGVTALCVGAVDISTVACSLILSSIGSAAAAMPAASTKVSSFLKGYRKPYFVGFYLVASKPRLSTLPPKTLCLSFPLELGGGGHERRPANKFNNSPNGKTNSVLIGPNGRQGRTF
jgi:hypothetical protein